MDNLLNDDTMDLMDVTCMSSNRILRKIIEYARMQNETWVNRGCDEFGTRRNV